MRLLEAIRIEIKLNRFQIATVLASSVGIVIAAAYFITRFHSIQLDAACTSVYEYPPGLVCPGTSMLDWVKITQQAEVIPPLLAFLPWVAGLLLGVPIVSQEIETKTVLLAWTVGPSRSRWLLRRVAVVLPFLLLAMTMAIAAGIALLGTQKPLIDPWRTFDQYDSHVVLMGRAMLAFAIGVLAGAYLGRLLPALIAGAVACALAALVAQAIFPSLAPPVELVTIDEPQGTPVSLSLMYRLDDGRLVSWEEVLLTAPDVPGTKAYDDWETALQLVGLGYPASMATEIAIREDIVTVLASGVVLLGAIFVVRRRRPY